MIQYDIKIVAAFTKKSGDSGLFICWVKWESNACRNHALECLAFLGRFLKLLLMLISGLIRQLIIERITESFLIL